MKKGIIFVLISTVFLGISSCKEEEKDDRKLSASLFISAISPATASHGDTLTVQYRADNIKEINLMQVKIKDIPVAPFEITSTDFKVVVPFIESPTGQNLWSGKIKLSITHPEYPNGYSKELMYKITAKIASISSFEGKGGDVITIKGRGFTEWETKLRLIINTLPAELAISNDSILQAIVPNGCGSGKMYIRYGSSYNEINAELGFFRYHFASYSGNIYPIKIKDSYSGTTVIERNANGSIAKKIFDKGDYDLETYHYNSFGLIETIYQYKQENLIGYQTYFRHSDWEIVHSLYDSQDELKRYNRYWLTGDKLMKWEIFTNNSGIYTGETGDFYRIVENNYTYPNDSTVVLNHLQYFPSGEQDDINSYDSHFKRDYPNLPLNMNIPGDPTASVLIENNIWDNGYPYRIYYNEYGLVIKTENIRVSLGEEYLGRTIEYEY